MITVRVEKQIEVSSKTVWAKLSNFGDLSWYRAANKVESTGAGVGMVRRVFMPDGGHVDETLESLNDTNMTLSYSIERTPVFPFDNYLALIELTTLSPNQTRIVWSCSTEVEGMPEADGKAMIEGFYLSLIEGLAGV